VFFVSDGYDFHYIVPFKVVKDTIIVNAQFMEFTQCWFTGRRISFPSLLMGEG
jgi:hypothetical protein